ncbi:HAD-IA family hydrolase [Candidatus Saccharibacteria bacterium]|nr:HAD-IA family hydrolase [Candidatus Saccharibacteria bacterium]
MIKLIIWDFYGVLYFPAKDELNSELFEFIEDHNKQYGFGIISAINSDLSEWLQQRKVRRYFQFVKTTSELGLPKTDPGLYETVVAGFGLKPNQVLLIDDSAENLNAAREAGLQTLRYAKTKPFLQQISTLL